MDAIRVLPPGMGPADLGALDQAQAETDEEAAQKDTPVETDEWMTDEFGTCRITAIFSLYSSRSA